MIKNIVFDIGNVLTDFRWADFIRDQGYDDAMVERIAKASVKSPEWHELDRGVWTDEEILDAFVKNDPEIEADIRKVYSNVAQMVTPRAYAIPWIQALKAKDYKVYYLSNFSRIAHVQCTEALAFLPYTDGGILSYMDKVIKPDPQIYQLLVDRFGLVAEECVFIDDLQVNVEAAKACGYEGIVFVTKEQVDADLKELGVEF